MSVAIFRRLSLLCWSLAASASSASADAVDSAYRLCRAMDATGLLSAPCSVSGWNSSVDISLDMATGEARQFCSMAPALTAQVGATFDPGWSLRIYSPYSGDNTIAVCPL